MTEKNSYSELNWASQKELTDFAAALTEENLTAHMPADWTVSAVFGHLAFWDFRNITLIKKWLAEGNVSTSPIDVDVVNEATRPLLIANYPHQAVQMALERARELDTLIDSLDPDFIHAIEAEGKAVRLDRNRHRQTHMNDIQAALGLK